MHHQADAVDRSNPPQRPPTNPAPHGIRRHPADSSQCRRHPGCVRTCGTGWPTRGAETPAVAGAAQYGLAGAGQRRLAGAGAGTGAVGPASLDGAAVHACAARKRGRRGDRATDQAGPALPTRPHGQPDPGTCRAGQRASHEARDAGLAQVSAQRLRADGQAEFWPIAAARAHQPAARARRPARAADRDDFGGAIGQGDGRADKPERLFSRPRQAFGVGRADAAARPAARQRPGRRHRSHDSDGRARPVAQRRDGHRPGWQLADTTRARGEVRPDPAAAHPCA